MAGLAFISDASGTLASEDGPMDSGISPSSTRHEGALAASEPAVASGLTPGAVKRGTPIVASEESLANVAYSSDGLVVAVVQEVNTREVLMVAYMDEHALRETLASGRSWFYSRSRREYWCKGETSGNRQWVRSVSYDCDGDALLIEVEQEGGVACHTGARSCFFRFFGDADDPGYDATDPLRSDDPGELTTQGNSGRAAGAELTGK